jgi:hypothetical protein
MSGWFATGNEKYYKVERSERCFPYGNGSGNTVSSAKKM